MGSKQEIISLQRAIDEHLNSHYPDHYINVFSRVEENFKKPAILTEPPIFEMHEWASARNFILNMKCNSFICYSSTFENADLEAIQFSAYLAKFINGNKWGLKLAPAKVIDIQPSKIEGLDNIVVQCVSWEQIIEITEDK